MSGFHGTVSRRTFMKALGLAGAGIGGAALAVPTFHDLDELASSGTSLQKHPWYIKEKEFLDPSIEVDWSIIKRYDRRWQGQMAHQVAVYYGTARADARTVKQAQVLDESLKSNRPGWDLKWTALKNSVTQNNRWSATHSGPVATTGTSALSWTTPDKLGVPKWQGSPEEASNLLRAATRLFGGGNAGFANYDSTWRNKLTVEYTTAGASDAKYTDLSVPFPPPDSASFKYVFKDGINFLEEDKNTGYIPTKNLWVLVIEGPEPRETDRTGRSLMSKSNLVSNQFLRNTAYYSTVAFIKGLGYNSGGQTGHQTDLFNAGAYTVLTGMSEASRQNNWVLSPEFGPRGFELSQLIDLPVESTRPIDAGMWRFCKTCGKCAKACPAECISTDKEPTYDIPTINGKPNTMTGPGIKSFHWNGALCNLWTAENGGSGTCSTCAANCTFSVGPKSMIHQVIKSTIPTTSLFNSFFATMGDTFGYGNYEDPDIWWRSSLPIFGIDSTSVARDGGYGK